MTKQALTGKRIAQVMMQHPLASYREIGAILAKEDGRKMPYGHEVVGKHYREWAKRNDMDMPRQVS
jgi:hypothetical protein